MSGFDYQKDASGIVTVTMDMEGPVNSMNQEYRDCMEETVERLESETDLTGVVFASAKKVFFAGGNLHELLAVTQEEIPAFVEMLHKTKGEMRRLEKLPVPVVAAINGAALGGGFELCLSCNHRIAWDDRSVQLGLPEVGLGLLPGGGGVVRMVNMLGLKQALPYLLEGTRVKPSQALAAGLIHETVASVNELVPRAKAWILENQGNEAAAVQAWDRKGHKIPGGNATHPANVQLISAASAMLFQKTRGLLPAPEKILDCAAEAARVDLDTALVVETRALANLAVTPEAKNQISTMFFGMNKINGGASRPKQLDVQQVKKVGVLGAGMMGQGVAYVTAMAGIEVVLKDLNLEAAQKGKAYSEKLLSKRLAKGRIDQSRMDSTLDLIKPTANDEDLAGCDLIIEAVFEDVELKHKITKDLQSYLCEDGVWGSNTSTLPITTLAEAADKPENFVGIHFFSPVDKMPLVEIICGEQTSDIALAKAFDYTRKIKKTPIVVNDSLGFYTSRVILSQGSEANVMVAEGVHPVRVENAGKAIGLPVGPLTLADEISLTLPLDIRKTHISLGLIDESQDPTPAATKLLNELVASGRLGKKVGAGFFDWSEDGKRVSEEVLGKYFQPELAISDDDIRDRLLFRPVIESLKCLEDGVLRSVVDGNVGSILGIGAPVWTGGYIQFVNTYGLERFIKRCEQLADRYGERFLPPQIVAEKLSKAEQFV